MRKPPFDIDLGTFVKHPDGSLESVGPSGKTLVFGNDPLDFDSHQVAAMMSIAAHALEIFETLDVSSDGVHLHVEFPAKDGECRSKTMCMTWK